MTPATPLTPAPAPSSSLDAPPATEVLDALPRLSHNARRHAVPARRPAPGRYLELDDGQERALLALRPGITRIGRGFGADVRLEDQSVSRRHAILYERPSATRILDDRSANGTFVNGRRVVEAELHDGDVVVLGRLVVTYRVVR